MTTAAPRGYDRRPSRPHDHDDRDAVVQAFALSTPYAAAQLLGLRLGRGDRSGPRRRTIRVLCPWHSDRTPSCDLTILRGRLVARCRSCNQGGDVLAIVAALEGLDARRDFGAVLARAAELVGVEVRRQGHRAPEARPETELDRARRELREERQRGEAMARELAQVRQDLALEEASRAVASDEAREVIAGLSSAIVATGEEVRLALGGALLQVARLRELLRASPRLVAREAALPEGADPDSYVREHGAAALRVVLLEVQTREERAVEAVRALLGRERFTRRDVAAAVELQEDGTT